MLLVPVPTVFKRLPVITTLDSFVDSTDRSTYTKSASALGTAAYNREIFLIGSGGVTSGTPTISSVTINGVSATHAKSTDAGSFLFYAFATVPTGTTGDIVVTLSATILDMAFSVFQVQHRMKIGETAIDFVWDGNGSGTSATIDTASLPSGAFSLGSIGHGNANAHTITGDFTEVHDVATGSGRAATAICQPSSGGIKTMNASWTSSAGNLIGVASFR